MGYVAIDRHISQSERSETRSAIICFLSVQEQLEIVNAAVALEASALDLDQQNVNEARNVVRSRMQMVSRRLKSIATAASHQALGVLVKGVPLGDIEGVPTPTELGGVMSLAERRMEHIVFALGECFGQCGGWMTEQNGRLVHDVVPIDGMENEQIGLSSYAELKWHVEDAYFDNRPDYLGLCCVRNHERAATTVGTLMPLRLPSRARNVLCSRRYWIAADTSHQRSGVSFGAAKVAALEVVDDSYRLRLDPAFMWPEKTDHIGRMALELAHSLVESELIEVTLEAGDFLLIDNRQQVHGRRSFQATYNGRQRWLKKVSIWSS